MNKTWEHIGAKDPYWGVLSSDEYRASKLDPSALGRFFATGETAISERLSAAAQAFGPIKMDTALDYGCGVGRLTLALSNRFKKTIAVDVSESMLSIARENLDGKQVEFEQAEAMSTS